MTIGNRVLQLLSEKKLKQKDLAEYLGTKPSTVNGWKEPNRNPSSELIVRICEFLGVSYEFLLTGKDSSINAISDEDYEWITLVHQLPKDTQLKFKGEIVSFLIDNDQVNDSLPPRLAELVKVASLLSDERAELVLKVAKGLLNDSTPL